MKKRTKEQLTRLLRSVAFLLPAFVLASALVVAIVQCEYLFRQKMIAREQRLNEEFQKELKRLLKDAQTVESPENLAFLEALFESESRYSERQLQVAQALGNLYLWKVRNGANVEARLKWANAAEKYFRYALEKLTEAKSKSVSRKLAIILMEQKKWAEAAIIFSRTENYKYDPFDRWENWLMWAECLWRSQQYYEALERVSKVVEECDNSSLRARAFRLKADILLEGAKDPDIAKDINGGRAPDKLDAYVAGLRHQAFQLYVETTRLLPAFNPDVGAADLGMLEILILDRKSDQAYKLANDIQGGSAPDDQKARALVMVAKMEDAIGDVEKAIEILTICKERYPKYEESDILTYNLYRLLLKNREWTAAFDLAKELIVDYHNKDLTREILRDFAPGKDRFPENLPLKAPTMTGPLKETRRYFLEEAFGMLNSIRGYPVQWHEFAPTVRSVEGFLFYYAEKYPEAQSRFAGVFDKSDRVADFESVARLDLLCALHLGLSPAIIAYRARRYLTAFPKGVYANRVTQIMLDAYYKMGLYEDALRIARNVYLEQLNLVALGQMENKEFSDTDWYKTIAMIGLCYEKLGNNDKANAIIRNYAAKFSGKPYAAQLYYDWAMIAARGGQEYEALRRCDLAAKNNPSDALRLKLNLARCMLTIKLGVDQAFPEGRKLLDALKAFKEMPEPEKRELGRQMSETLLRYALERDQTAFNELLMDATRDYRDEIWPEYWVLRYFTPMFEQYSYSEIKTRHDEMLNSDFIRDNKNSVTFAFLKRQMGLLEKQLNIQNMINTFRKKGL